MNRTISSSRLGQTALQSGLVTQEQLSETERRLRAQRRPIDGAALADELVRANVITAYQADQLRAGRTKFTLGPYVITDALGQGGMGQVFKAQHEMMGREVAIKVLPQEKSSPDAIASFTREIRTQAQSLYVSCFWAARHRVFAVFHSPHHDGRPALLSFPPTAIF